MRQKFYQTRRIHHIKRKLITETQLLKLLKAIIKRNDVVEDFSYRGIEVDVFAPHFVKPIYRLILREQSEVVLHVNFSKSRKLKNSSIWILRKEEADSKDIKHCVQTSSIFDKQIITPLVKHISEVSKRRTVYIAFDTNTYTVLKNLTLMRELKRKKIKNVRYVALIPVKAEITSVNPPIFGPRYLRELQKLWKLDRKTLLRFKGAPLLSSRKWILAQTAYNYTLNSKNTIEIGNPYKGDAEITTTLRKLKKKKPTSEIILVTFDKHIPQDALFERFTLYYPSTAQLKQPVITTLENIANLIHISTIIFQTITLKIRDTQTEITLTKHWGNTKTIRNLKKDKLAIETTTRQAKRKPTQENQ